MSGRQLGMGIHLERKKSGLVASHQRIWDCLRESGESLG